MGFCDARQGLLDRKRRACKTWICFRKSVDRGMRTQKQCYAQPSTHFTRKRKLILEAWSGSGWVTRIMNSRNAAAPLVDVQNGERNIRIRTDLPRLWRWALDEIFGINRLQGSDLKYLRIICRVHSYLKRYSTFIRCFKRSRRLGDTVSWMIVSCGWKGQRQRTQVT